MHLDKISAELAIRNVINLYGLAADCGDIDVALACHMEDAVYVVSSPRAGRDGQAEDLHLHGHQAIRDMLLSEMHQSLLPNCGHTVGPLVVRFDNATSAEVLGYSRVYNKKDDMPILMRLAFNKWNMNVDSDGSWKIARRESRVMGEEKAQDMLRKNIGRFV